MTNSNYNHLMDDFKISPLQIKKHIVDDHKVEPNLPRKRYERECWHSQHEYLHRLDGYESEARFFLDNFLRK